MMKRIGNSIMAWALTFISMAGLVMPVNLGMAYAASATKISSKPIPYFVPGKRIQIEAIIADREGVDVVRCYFKSQEQADYVFVDMKPKVNAANTYVAVLPAPSANTQSIQYFFLVVNRSDQVVNTYPMQVNADRDKAVPYWQNASMEGQIKVSTELAEVIQAPEGFTDSIAMDLVESAARFGLVAGGIYAASKIARAGILTGRAAHAVHVSTITVDTSASALSQTAQGKEVSRPSNTANTSTVATAGSGSSMLPAMLLIGACAAGVAVAAGGAGGSSGGSSSSSSSGSSSPTCASSGYFMSTTKCGSIYAYACSDGTGYYGSSNGQKWYYTTGNASSVNSAAQSLVNSCN
jgi:hypothetical protein